MRVTSISVADFLGLATAAVDVDRSFTVITGPNGSGKSTLLQALNLARDAVHRCATGTIFELDREWATAGHGGASSFEVRIGISFDAADERDLIDAYYHAAVLRLVHPEATDIPALVTAVARQLPAGSAAPMLKGTLVVSFDNRQRSHWTVGWQFDQPGGTAAHVQLYGQYLTDGPVTAGPSNIHVVSELCASTNDIVDKISRGDVKVQVWPRLPGCQVQFTVSGLNAPGGEPAPIAAVLEATGRTSNPQDQVHFSQILNVLLARRLQVTDNHRAPARAHFASNELTDPPDLRDGSLLAIELHRLKNGAAHDRNRFAVVQRLFTALTGERFDCIQHVSPGPDGSAQVTLMPAIEFQTSGGDVLDVPLHRAGAGASEALLLAALLADERRCLFLDEPGIHLSPTAQRRLLTMLRSRQATPGQALWITHNPDLVPTHDEKDLSSIVRISRGVAKPVVSTVALTSSKDTAAMRRLFASSEVRRLLFAAAVVLVEGPTDIAAVPRWLDAGVTKDGDLLPTPDAQNVAFMSVEGDTAFGAYIVLAKRLGVPWAIIADGPALAPESPLAKQLKKLGKNVPQTGAKLADVRNAWASQGVFTLAQEFGNDGSKTGEIEAFFGSVDASTLAKVRQDVGAEKGTRVGAAFADAVKCPDEVAALWQDLLRSLGLLSKRGSPIGGSATKEQKPA